MSITAAIGAGSSIIGGLMGGGGVKKAAKIQAEAAREAQRATRLENQRTRADLAPWRSAGTSALNRLEYLLGTGGDRESLKRAEQVAYDKYMGLASQDEPGWPEYEQARNELIAAREATARAQPGGGAGDPEYGSLMSAFGADDFEADPGYQFRLSEGLKGIENSAAARGNQLSGAAMKGLGRYASGLASQEYGAAYGRDAADKARKYNYLSGLSGQGLGAVTQTGMFGARSTGSIADLMTQGANAQAAGVAGQAQARGNALGGIADAARYYDLMRELRKDGKPAQPAWGAGTPAWGTGMGYR